MPLGPLSLPFCRRSNEKIFKSQGCRAEKDQIPPMLHELIDAEFADDMVLYLRGNLDNMQKAEKAIKTFCQASGARINWNKIVGFWVGADDPPTWFPDPCFKWIPKGTNLGCQIGLEI